MRIRLSLIRQAATNRPAGYEEDVISRGQIVGGEYLELSRENYQALLDRYRPSFGGPGTELKKLLSRIGITSTPTCSCNKRAKTMDENGIEWCEENIETICDWLAEESAKRKLPFIRSAGKLLIRMAIRNAKKGISQ